MGESCDRRTRGTGAPEEPTTLMIRNLPIRATLSQIFDHLDSLGCGGYDYVKFPRVSGTKSHKGYAFVAPACVQGLDANINGQGRYKWQQFDQRDMWLA